jgi:hypothetical protein
VAARADRGHLVRRIVAILPDAKIRVGHLTQPSGEAGAIVDILHRPSDVVLSLRNAIIRIVGETDVAPIG